jgi:DNA anti-recombination protein RmuC
MYSAEQLADRYKISKVGLIKFVRSNLDEINKDGQNAYQAGSKNEWHFTADAVKIIDKLRGAGVTVIAGGDDARVIELLEQVSTLKTIIANQQQKQIQLQQQLLDERAARVVLLEQQQESVRLLATAQASTEALNARIDDLQQRADQAEQERDELRQKAEAEQHRFQAELQKERNKSWWDRLCGK